MSLPVKANFERPLSALPLPKVSGKVTDEELRAFTSAKLDRLNWIMRDPDPRMTPTAKLVGLYLLQCVNSETLQCNPSYRTIADVLGFKTEKTAERAIAALVQCGWLEIRRFDRTKSNRYVFLVNGSRTKAIDEYQMLMADKRAENRDHLIEQTSVSGRRLVEQTSVSGPEQTNMSGKHLKGTPEVILGYEEEGPLKVSPVPSINPYALAKDDDRHVPYPVPASVEELTATLQHLFEGCGLSPELIGAMRKMLTAGRLTPAMVEEQRRFAS